MDDICRTYGLRPVELDDKPLFDAAFASLQRPLSEYTFANTFIWRTGEKLYWAPVAGHLCVFADGEDDLTMLYPPVGEGDLDVALRRCFEIMDDYNARRLGRHRSRIEYVSDELLQRLAGPGMQARPMGADYVYDTARLIELTGSDLKSKRHARNKFLRTYEARTEPFRPEHFDRCMQLLHTWAAGPCDGDGDGRGRGGAGSAAGDFARDVVDHRRRLDALATEEAMKHCAQLGLQGMVLWAGEHLVGFTFGEPLSPIQSSILIEKAHRDVVGAAQYIFSQFCSEHWRDYPQCNAGDDWDIPSLAWTKESYRPVERLQKWTLSQQRASVHGYVARRTDPPTGTPATFRPAEPRDAAAVTALEQRTFAPGEAFKKGQVRYLLRSPRVVVRVAEADGQIVAWAVALLRRHRHGTSARLYSLAVDEGWRRRGIGEALVTALLQQLEGQGVLRCYLEVRQDNDGALRLYESFGFRRLKSLPDYYGEGVPGWRMVYSFAQAGPGQPASSRSEPVSPRLAVPL